MGSSEFIPFAIGAGANIEDQGSYQAEIAIAQGFTGGLARATLHNKLFRQSSFIASAIAQFVVGRLDIDVNDDGDLQNFVNNFTLALLNLITSAQGNFYTFDGIPTGNVAGNAGTITSPPDLCEDIANGDIYVCIVSGDATNAVWQVVSNQPDAPGVAQSGAVSADRVTSWAGNAVVKDSGVNIAALMLKAGGFTNGNFPIWNGSTFVDSQCNIGNNIVLYGGVSSGSANAQAVTTVPDIVTVALRPNLLLFIPGFTNTGAMTINPSDIGPIQVRKPTASGPAPLSGGEVILGCYSLMAYRGDNNTYTLLNAAPQPSGAVTGGGGGSSGGVVTPPGQPTSPGATGGGSTPGGNDDNKGGNVVYNDPGSPDTVIRIECRGVKLTTTTGLVYNLANANFSCNTLINGVNGLDQGTLASNSGYYFYLIANGGGAVGCLASLAFPTPKLPAGYIYFAPVLWCATDAQRRFYRFWSVGNDYVYNPGPFSPLIDYPIIVTGAFNGQINIAARGAPLAPPEATHANIQVHHTPLPGDKIVIAPVNQPLAPIHQISFPPAVPVTAGETRTGLRVPLTPKQADAQVVMTLITEGGHGDSVPGAIGMPAVRITGFKFP